jgi:hypothetical protein
MIVDENEFKKIVADWIREIAIEIAKEQKLTLRQMDGVATARLVQSVEVTRDFDKDISYVIDWKAPYSIFVEYGTSGRDKLPPVESIEKWVRAKFGIGGKEARRIAWAIAQEIKKHGTKPKPFGQMGLMRALSKLGLR